MKSLRVKVLSALAAAVFGLVLVAAPALSGSIPGGDKVTVEYSPSNDGTADTVTATITNTLSERFEYAFLRFVLPKAGADEVYAVSGGDHFQTIEGSDKALLYVSVYVPSTSEVTVVAKVYAKPAAPVSMTASDTIDDNGGSITVIWALSVDDGGGRDIVTGYQILRSTTSGSGYAAVGSVAAGVSTYVDGTTTDGTNYYYVVRVTDDYSYSDTAESGPVQSVDNLPPGKVSMFQATPGYERVTLTWLDPPDTDLAGTRVMRKQGDYPSRYDDGTMVYSGTAGSYVDNAVINGATYYYAAFAYDGRPNYAGADAGSRGSATPGGEPPATEPPTAQFTYPTAAEWFGGTLIITATASDPDGTVDDVTFDYSLNSTTGSDGDWQQIARDTSSPYTVSWDTQPAGGTDDSVWLRVHSTDNYGATSPYDLQRIKVDNQRPVSSDDSTGDWSNTDVTVTITEADAADGSGVTATYYTTDGTTPTTSSALYTSPITFVMEGEHTLKYFSVDAMGNTQIVKTANPVRIDKTRPTADAGDNMSVQVDTNVMFSGLDSTDDVEVTSYKWDVDDSDGVDFDSPDFTGHTPIYSGYAEAGSYVVTLQVADAAGNTATDSIVVGVTGDQPDETPPVIDHTPITSADENEDIAVTATVTDDCVVVSVILFYRKRGDTAYTGITLDHEGDTYAGDIPAEAAVYPGVEYYLYASDGSGGAYSGSSGSPHFISVVDDVPPGAIQDLIVIPVSQDSVTLGWTPPGDNGMSGTADHYHIKYAITNITEDTWSSANTLPNDLTPQSAGAPNFETFTASGFDGESSYYFAVKTLDEVSNISDISNIAVLDREPPAAPIPIRVALGNTSLTVHWQANTEDDIHGYNVYRKSATETSYTKVNADVVLAVSFDDGGVDFGVQYTYYLTAIDNFGNTSGASAQLSQTLYMPGDSDGNNLVTIADVTPMIYLYGAAEGDSDYVARVDANRDGVIDANDIPYISYNYDMTPSTYNPSAARAALLGGNHAPYVQLYRALRDAVEGMAPSEARTEAVDTLARYIELGENQTVADATLDLEAGWNLVALPFNITRAEISSALVSAGVPAGGFLVYRYANGAYRKVEDAAAIFVPGEAFWLKAPAAVSPTFSGTAPESAGWEVPLVKGWTLVGNPLRTDVPMATRVQLSFDGGATFAPAADYGDIPHLAFVQYRGGGYSGIGAGDSVGSFTGCWVYSPADAIIRFLP